MDSIVTRNYSTDGGDTLIIGGKLIIEEGAVVEGLSGAGSGAAANQAASTATAVAALRTDFNALLTKLKEAGIMIADTWNITAGLAPTPTEEALIENKAKATVSLEGDEIIIAVNVDELTESASSDPNQGTHKWLALEIGTGFADITKVQYNGADLTAQDVSDAQATGCATGSFVLYIRTEEVAETPKTITLDAEGFSAKSLTIRVAAPVETEPND